MSDRPPESSVVPQADVWSGWQLLAYSGLDGQTDWARGREARLLADRLGLTFEGDPRLDIVVHARLDGEPLTTWTTVGVASDRVVAHLAGDALAVTLGLASQGQVRGSIGAGPGLDAAEVYIEITADACTRIEDGALSVGSERLRLVAEPSCECCVCRPEQVADVLAGELAGRPHYLGEPCRMTLLARLRLSPGRAAQFALSLWGDQPAPIALSDEALARWSTLPSVEPNDLPANQQRALAKARAILRAAVMAPEGQFSRPWMVSQRRPPHDAAATRGAVTWHAPWLALAMAGDEPDLAADVLLGVLGQQAGNGMVPDAVWPDGQTHEAGPPLLCWGFWRLYQHTGDRDWLTGALPRLKDYAKYPLATRLLGRMGHARSEGARFLSWGRGEGAGMDNSPRFDLNEPFAAVDYTALCVAEIELLARIIEEVTPEHREAVHLAWMGEELGRETREHFWSEEHAFFVDRYADGEAVDALTIAGWLPLFAGLASDAQAAALVERHLGPTGDFHTTLPLPSLAQTDPRCDQNMWRGAAFPAVSILVIEGLRRYGYDSLADALRQRTVDSLTRWYERTGTFWEYYDAGDQRSPADLPRGRRIGAWPEDAWTAAAYVLLTGSATAVGGSATAVGGSSTAMGGSA